MSLRCLGYFGKNILWIGLSDNTIGGLQVCDDDTEKQELKELKDKRVDHQEVEPQELHPLGNKFYYTGRDGRLMSVNLSSQ